MDWYAVAWALFMVALAFIINTVLQEDTSVFLLGMIGAMAFDLAQERRP